MLKLKAAILLRGGSSPTCQLLIRIELGLLMVSFLATTNAPLLNMDIVLVILLKIVCL